MTLLNLGRHFSVNQSLWPTLCVRIEELMAGQACLVDVDLPRAAALEAERLVEQLQLHSPSAQPVLATPAKSETQSESESKPKPKPKPKLEPVPETDV